MSQSTSDLQTGKIFAKADVGTRRTRLREFQAQLVERMQTARSGEDTRINQLGVMIGGNRWLLDLQTAGEIVSVGTITAVPLTQPWFLGLANIRGNLISVIDFAGFQGQAPTAIDKDCRIVAFSPALSFNSGLLVSRVLGLHNVAEMERQADGEPSAPWVSKRYIDRESQVWRELDLSLVIQNPQFLHVGL
ncbi:putative chemotaxis signal transduction protein CheW-like, putative PilI [Herminiimonas arsenicoxydans]|uniref:Chemotaxis signal transduction protein CheW-like, putative PilI n=1 Tax=Herminiimonas arsenicoxydans TaxID=204773 RepID=A4G8M5_HERAR|nr:putative chemotaxis signal transduction protein CheW-like, putative PilI [Herminiimonas arsenicoxydans]